MNKNDHNISRLREIFILTLHARNMNYSKFAKAHGVTRSYISQVMTGKLSVSPRIAQAIQNFISTNKSNTMKSMMDVLNS